MSGLSRPVDVVADTDASDDDAHRQEGDEEYGDQLRLCMLFPSSLFWSGRWRCVKSRGRRRRRVRSRRVSSRSHGDSFMVIRPANSKVYSETMTITKSGKTSKPSANILHVLPFEVVTLERLREIYKAFLRADAACETDSDCSDGECSDGECTEDDDRDAEDHESGEGPDVTNSEGDRLLDGSAEESPPTSIRKPLTPGDPIAEIDEIIGRDWESEDVAERAYAEYLKYQKNPGSYQKDDVEPAWESFEFDPSDKSLLIEGIDGIDDSPVSRHELARRQYFLHYLSVSYDKLTEVFPGLYAVWDEDGEAETARDVQIYPDSSCILIGAAALREKRARAVTCVPILEGYIDVDGLTKKELKGVLKDLHEGFTSKTVMDYLQSRGVKE